MTERKEAPAKTWTPADWLAHAHDSAVLSLDKLIDLAACLCPGFVEGEDDLIHRGPGATFDLDWSPDGFASSSPDGLSEQEVGNICSIGASYLDLVEALKHVSPLFSRATDGPVKACGHVGPHSHAVAASIVETSLHAVWEAVSPFCTLLSFNPKNYADSLFDELCAASREKVSLALRGSLPDKGLQWVKAAIDREYEVATLAWLRYERRKADRADKKTDDGTDKKKYVLLSEICRVFGMKDKAVKGFCNRHKIPVKQESRRFWIALVPFVTAYMQDTNVRTDAALRKRVAKALQLHEVAGKLDEATSALFGL